MIQPRDIRMFETGSGGDFQGIGSDLKGAFSFENFLYIAMFGGNPASITSEKTEGEENFDYWGNELLWSNNPEVQFNSRTEKVLREVALNSSGRKSIQEAVESDLEFMGAFAEITVVVELPKLDTVKINISVKEPNNEVEKRFMYIWDGARLIDESTDQLNKPVVFEDGLQEVLQFDLG